VPDASRRLDLRTECVYLPLSVFELCASPAELGYEDIGQAWPFGDGGGGDAALRALPPSRRSFRWPHRLTSWSTTCTRTADIERPCCTSSTGLTNERLAWSNRVLCAVATFGPLPPERRSSPAYPRRVVLASW
jgi:hypothetical protein